MKDSISLTIPLNYNALSRAADMLNGLAGDIALNEVKTPVLSGSSGDSIATEAITENWPTESIDKLTPPVPVDPTPAPATDDAAIFDAPITDTGVELDADGLPWDSRIHGSKKLKLAKDDRWKKIRGVDPQLVATVEAELRQVMSIPVPAGGCAPSIIVPAAPVSPAPVDPVPAAPVAPAPVDPVPAAPVAITFPELMAKITGAGYTIETVAPVLNKYQIAALPLLAARPDLIPAVHADLFPNG